ncbi:unnamed protein product [Calicophoron daubneyi]|uniref:Uncharacterized protein n=1 Tax=Calicophoron daubneyi TaxID=300641 RepID=A0AAV2THU1_CALDB
MSLRDEPTLLWDLIEQRLSKNERHEARLLVGLNIIEQTYELKNEITSFLRLLKDNACISRAFQLVVSRPPSLATEVAAQITAFVNAYHEETFTTNKILHSKVKTTKAKSEFLQEESRLQSATSEIRKYLIEEAAELERHLHKLQTALLGNFEGTGAVDGDLSSSAIPAQIYKLAPEGDQRTDTIFDGSGLQLVNSGCALNDHRTPTCASRSSGSTLSATSSASVSPRSPANTSETEMNHSATKPGMNNNLTKLKHHDQLSPSSHQLRRSAGTQQTPLRSVTQTRSFPLCGSDSVSPISLPPLTPKRQITKSVRSNIHSSVMTNRSESTTPTSDWCSPDLGRFNSAQRFRQMILQTRIDIARSNTLKEKKGNSKRTQ